MKHEFSNNRYNVKDQSHSDIMKRIINIRKRNEELLSDISKKPEKAEVKA